MGMFSPKTKLGKILLLLAFLFLVLFSAFIFYVLDLMGGIKKGSPDQKNIDVTHLLEGNKYDINADGNYWIGASSPIVTIFEFSDFACLYCKNSFSNIREITAKYPGQVRFIVKDYPLHDESDLLALAGRCAGEQGLFWPMYDKLFINQGVAEGSEVALIAGQIGADTSKFETCMNANKYLSAIQKDYSEGQSLGITGTPTWFINGYRVNGDIPRDTFFGLIDALIQKN